MKKIPLTQHKFAVVDDEDYERVSQYKCYAHWNGDRWYARLCSPTGHRQAKVVYLHRFILQPRENEGIDHINGNGLDCRRANLRIASQTKNNANQRLRKSNKSGYKGVSWFKPANQWRAQIGCDGRKHYLGYFHSPEEAARAYDKKAKELFGEFARTNFPG